MAYDVAMYARLFIVLAILLVPIAVRTDDPATPRPVLLIVHAAHLGDAADEWADYRRQTGWQVKTLSVLPFKDADARAEELLTQISNAWGDALAAGATDFTVLLLGDADLNGIPTFRFHQDDPDLLHHRDSHFASDHPYCAGDMTSDQPHFPLGRIPAQSLDEARLALAKVKAYEANNAPALWQRRINCLAGEGHFGPLDQLLEHMFTTMVDSLVPATFDMSMTYAKPTSMFCPPVNAIVPTVLGRLGEDALLFVYVGHGAPTSLDDFHWNGERLPVLRNSDLDKLTSSSAHRPIAVLACCSTGWFDLPNGEQSLSEAMLFAPDGPIAVIAGSRPTHPYASAVLLESMTRRTTSNAARTLGELDMLITRDMLRAPSMRDGIDLIAQPIATAMQWSTSLRSHRKMHVRLYNLLGDPCLTLPERGNDIALKRVGNAVTGRIDNMKSGTVVATIQTARDQPAHVHAMKRITGDDDPELPAKSQFNYQLANDRILSDLSVEVVDGVFEFDLPSAMDSRARFITLHAVGVDLAGKPCTAHGALSIARTR